MAESEPGAIDAQSAAGAPRELPPAELERLADLVYRLLKNEILRGRERRGESMAGAWR